MKTSKLVLSVGASIVPLVVVTLMINAFASSAQADFSAAWKNSAPQILGVWIFSLLMFWLVPKKFYYTKMLSVIGSQIGLVLHILILFKSSALATTGLEHFAYSINIRRLIDQQWFNWITVLGLAGLVIGFLLDQYGPKKSK